MYRSDDLGKPGRRTTMKRRIERWRTRFRPSCPPTSTNLSTTTGCGSRDAAPPRAPATARRSVWWVAWAAWSSGGVCTRTSRGPPTCRRSPTCTSSSWASSPCGRTPPTSTEGNGRCGYARRRLGARGRTCAWRCWASSSCWGPRSAASSSPCASRKTIWRCGTGRRATARPRRACTTPCGASFSCPRPCPSRTRSTPRCVRTRTPRAPSTHPVRLAHPARPAPSCAVRIDGVRTGLWARCVVLSRAWTGKRLL